MSASRVRLLRKMQKNTENFLMRNHEALKGPPLDAESYIIWANFISWADNQLEEIDNEMCSL